MRTNNQRGKISYLKHQLSSRSHTESGLGCVSLFEFQTSFIYFKELIKSQNIHTANHSKHLLIYVETKTQEKHPNVLEIKEIWYENCCSVYRLTLLLSCIFYIVPWQAGSSDSLHEIRTLQVQSRSICLADREGSFRSLSHFPETAGTASNTELEISSAA